MPILECRLEHVYSQDMNKTWTGQWGERDEGPRGHAVWQLKAMTCGRGGSGLQWTGPRTNSRVRPRAVPHSRDIWPLQRTEPGVCVRAGRRQKTEPGEQRQTERACTDAGAPQLHAGSVAVRLEQGPFRDSGCHGSPAKQGCGMCMAVCMNCVAALEDIKVRNSLAYDLPHETRGPADGRRSHESRARDAHSAGDSAGERISRRRAVVSKHRLVGFVSDEEMRREVRASPCRWTRPTPAGDADLFGARGRRGRLTPGGAPVLPRTA